MQVSSHCGTLVRVSLAGGRWGHLEQGVGSSPHVVGERETWKKWQRRPQCIKFGGDWSIGYASHKKIHECLERRGWLLAGAARALTGSQSS